MEISRKSSIKRVDRKLIQMENDTPTVKHEKNNSTLNWILGILIIIGIMTAVKNFNLISQETFGNTHKYEYKIEYFSDFSNESDLNNYGEEGWKIVGSRRATSSGKYGYELILMKEY